jgi:hypothetical protein
MAEKKDGWDKLRIIATTVGALGAVAIPIVVAIVGSEVNTSLKERDIDVQMIELAVSILQQEPSPDTEALRDWAVRMVDKHSGEPLSEEAKLELMLRALPPEIEARFRSAIWGKALDDLHEHIEQKKREEEAPASE